ncbi:MAG TPA: hypothetical protein VF750_01875 [Sphingomicrobium sp.]
MRAIISILVLVIIIGIALVATGYVRISNFRGQPPVLTATRNSVTVGGGEATGFEVQAGSVKVGTENKTVSVPTSVRIEKPSRNEAPATKNAM